MTPGEVVAEMKSDSLLNSIRRVISDASGEIANGAMQRVPPGPIEIRNIEFDAAIRVAALLGVELKPGQGENEGATPSP
jgi:hypothetical protein